ncbi:MAG: thioredoxin [Opitutaceae bacterium]|nr:thioredoxin [Cytophagales bacterium]
MSAYNDLINSPQPVLVDFTAEWCGPCKTMAPELKKLASEFGEKLKIIKIDIDKNQELAGKLQVKSVPTLILYKNGKQVWRQSGAMMAHQLKPVLLGFI